jgi:thiamine-monophosphate kinase
MSPRRGEDALTAKISAAARRLAPRRAKGTRLVVGIGDDAAVVDIARGRYVFTTDTLVETIDFLPADRPETVGRRAAAANLSDLAAMGADPEGYLLTIGLGPGRRAAYAERIAAGVLAKMRPFGAALWGGDLSRAPATFVTIGAAGRAPHPIERSGAGAGDRLFATGRPGSAAEALALRRSRPDGAARAGRGEKPYLDPEPRVAFARELARRRWATAMIDVSDGIGKDAHRLARSSRVRIVFFGIPAAVLGAASDDFELLFTAPPRHAAGILALGRRYSTPVSEVGRVERGRGIFAEERGRRRRVPERGYDHLA